MFKGKGLEENWKVRQWLYSSVRGFNVLSTDLLIYWFILQDVEKNFKILNCVASAAHLQKRCYSLNSLEI